MRRVWLYLRDLVWTAVVAVALGAIALIALALGEVDTAGVLALLAVGSAILSVRS
jgi:hypothetical protein